MYFLQKKTPAKFQAEITNQEASIIFLVRGPFFDAPCFSFSIVYLHEASKSNFANLTKMFTKMKSIYKQEKWHTNKI